MSEEQPPDCPNCGSKLWPTTGWNSRGPFSYWFCVRCGKSYKEDAKKELHEF